MALIMSWDVLSAHERSAAASVPCLLDDQLCGGEQRDECGELLPRASPSVGHPAAFEQRRWAVFAATRHPYLFGVRA